MKVESHSVVSNSLRPHGLYSPWNSPCQNTGVGSLSLLQGIFLTQESNRGLLHCRWILYQLSHREAQGYWSGQAIPSPGDHSDPGFRLGSPILEADSLPTELSGKPNSQILLKNKDIADELFLILLTDLFGCALSPLWHTESLVVACGTRSLLGIESGPSALGVQSLSPWAYQGGPQMNCSMRAILVSQSLPQR